MASEYEQFKEISALLNAQLQVELPPLLVEALDAYVHRLTKHFQTDDDWRLGLRVIYEIVGMVMMAMSDDEICEQHQTELAVTGLCLYLGRIISDPRALPLIKEWSYEDNEEDR